MAESVSNRPWGDISEADYSDAGALCDASLINQNTGPRSDWTKGACKLRYREPAGPINRNGVHAAAGVLAGARGGVDATPAEKRTAARKLVSIYENDLKEQPPSSLVELAR